jgi:serine/threonine-protein kinase
MRTIMSDETRIQQLLEETLESGRAPEEVCADFPELLWRVLEGLRQCQVVEAQIDAMFPRSSEGMAARRRRLISAGDSVPQIPGYDVGAVLGRGGVGVVYRAKHLKLNRYVALKMLLSGTYADPHELARFAREAEAVASLRHAHIVQVYDISDFDGKPYFTMELMEGGSLTQKLAGMPQPAEQAAALLVTLATAAHAAHAGGIVHRDLKPSNILLTDDGTPKISDFGLARWIARDSTITKTTAHVGTPSYMAPEQALGNVSAIGPPTDVYALGAILYELLTGRPPFRAATDFEGASGTLPAERQGPPRPGDDLPRVSA